MRRLPPPAVENNRAVIASEHYLLAAAETLAKIKTEQLNQAGLLAYAQACATVALAGRLDDLPEQIGHELR